MVLSTPKKRPMLVSYRSISLTQLKLQLRKSRPSLRGLKSADTCAAMIRLTRLSDRGCVLMGHAYLDRVLWSRRSGALDIVSQSLPPHSDSVHQVLRIFHANDSRTHTSRVENLFATGSRHDSSD